VQVKVETDVNVTSHRDDDVTDDVVADRDVIESCAARLNDSLQHAGLLDPILSARMTAADREEPGPASTRPLTLIGATAACPQARMTAAGFLYLTSGWKCPPRLVLDRQRWRCATRLYSVRCFRLP